MSPTKLFPNFISFDYFYLISLTENATHEKLKSILVRAANLL